MRLQSFRLGQGTGGLRRGLEAMISLASGLVWRSRDVPGLRAVKGGNEVDN